MTTHSENGAYRWVWGGASQQGARQEQQDRWAVFHTPPKRPIFAIVADGMGGHIGGAIGAQTVIDTAQRLFEEERSTDITAALCRLCCMIHEEIRVACETARSTVVMAWIDPKNDSVCWLNVGDSRLYHFRDGQRLMRTRDHSAVQLLADMGEISEAEMATHPAQNRLYRSLGGQGTPKPDSGSLSIVVGDLLVLCSDGIWEYITESEMWEAGTIRDPLEAAEVLVDMAVLRGDRVADNASIIILRAAPNIETLPPTVGWQERVATQLRSFIHRFGQSKT